MPRRRRNIHFCGVDLHAVRNAGLGPRRSANTRSVCFASVPFAASSKARIWPPEIVDIDHAFIGREGQPLGKIMSSSSRVTVPRSGETR